MNPSICPLSMFMSDEDNFRLSLWFGGIPLDYFLVALADVLGDEDPGIWMHLLKKSQDPTLGLQHDDLWTKVFWRLLDLCEKTLGGPIKLTDSKKRNSNNFIWRSSRFIGNVSGNTFQPSPNLLFSEENTTITESLVKKIQDSKQKCGMIQNYKDNLTFENNLGYLALFLKKLYEVLPLEKKTFDQVIPEICETLIYNILGSNENYGDLRWTYPLQLPAELQSVFPGIRNSDTSLIDENTAAVFTMFGKEVIHLARFYIKPTIQQKIQWDKLNKGDLSMLATGSYAGSKKGSVKSFPVKKSKKAIKDTGLDLKSKEVALLNSSSESAYSGTTVNSSYLISQKRKPCVQNSEEPTPPVRLNRVQKDMMDLIKIEDQISKLEETHEENLGLISKAQKRNQEIFNELTELKAQKMFVEQNLIVSQASSQIGEIVTGQTKSFLTRMNVGESEIVRTIEKIPKMIEENPEAKAFIETLAQKSLETTAEISEMQHPESIEDTEEELTKKTCEEGTTQQTEFPKTYFTILNSDKPELRDDLKRTLTPQLMDTTIKRIRTSPNPVVTPPPKTMSTCAAENERNTLDEHVNICAASKEKQVVPSTSNSIGMMVDDAQERGAAITRDLSIELPTISMDQLNELFAFPTLDSGIDINYVVSHVTIPTNEPETADNSI